MEHLPELDSVCCIVKSGRAFLCDLCGLTAEELDHGIKTESGATQKIANAAWSPDQLYCILIDENTQFAYLKTKDLSESYQQIPLSGDSGTARDSRVDVGWGKTETQFQGKAGKQAREVAKPSEYTAHSTDDKFPYISWRPDSQLFAISYFVEGTRKIKVFNLDGSFFQVSEPLPGLIGALSWSSENQFITSVQLKKSPPGLFVIFLEKNGYKYTHSEIKICDQNDGSIIISHTLWNSQKFLCVVVYDIKANKSIIQIWKKSNAQWYQKFQDINDLNGKISAIQWDPLKPFRLHVLLPNNTYQNYDFINHVTHCDGNVAILNGGEINCTDFKKTKIPPPMAGTVLKVGGSFEEHPRSPSFCQKEPHNKIGVVVGKEIRVYFDKKMEGENYKTIASGEHYNTVYQIEWTEDDVIVAFVDKCRVVRNESNEDDRLHTYGTGDSNFERSVQDSRYSMHDNESGSESSLSDSDKFLLILPTWDTKTSQAAKLKQNYEPHPIPLLTDITNFCVSNDLESSTIFIYIQTIDNEIEKYSVPMYEQDKIYDLDDFTDIYPENFGSFPREIQVLKCVKPDVLIGLSTSGSLFLLNYGACTELSYNVTSFIIHEGRFIITTLNTHQMQVIPLDIALEQGRKQGGNGKIMKLDSDLIHHRKIENGASLLAASDIEIIFQMPRGNIETIVPRALVVHKMRSMFDKGEYKQAFQLIRKNRVNMNLLYDDNFIRFEKNAAEFLEQIGYEDMKNGLHIFLADLIDQDTRKSEVYKAIYNSVDYQKETSSIAVIPDSKTNRICDLFLSISGEKSLKVYVSCCLRSRPAKIKEALLKIKEHIDSDDEKLNELGEQAVKQVLVIMDDKNRVYKEALGTYNKEIFIMIAKRSQHDPSEFYQILKDLEPREPEAYRKASIDVYLKRFSSALKNFSECEEEERLMDAINLAKKHDLLELLVGFYEEGGEFYKKVCEELAIFYEKDSLEKSAIYWQYAGRFDKASQAWERRSQWERALNCYKISRVESENKDEEYQKYALELASKLSGRDRNLQAAEIYLNHCEKSETHKNLAFECMLKACVSGNAAWRKIDLFYTTHYSEVKKNLTEILENSNNQLKKSVLEVETLGNKLLQVFRTRLDEIRENHEQLIPESTLDMLFGGQGGDNMSIDSASVSQMSSSLKSSKSGHKSKNARKKAYKKKYNAKDGSRSEHLGKLTELHKKYAEINQTLSDLPEFIQACLVYSISPASISELNATCKDVIYRATELSKRVWPHGNDNFNPLDANAVVNSKYQILTKCIDTGIEVKKLEEDHQREFGHRLGGMFLDPGHDLQLLVPASINSTFQDFQ
jgi:elongator complex protein 1